MTFLLALILINLTSGLVLGIITPGFDAQDGGSGLVSALCVGIIISMGTSLRFEEQAFPWAFGSFFLVMSVGLFSGIHFSKSVIALIY